MKKITTILFTLIIAVSLCACGTAQNSKSDINSSDSTVYDAEKVSDAANSSDAEQVLDTADSSDAEKVSDAADSSNAEQVSDTADSSETPAMQNTEESNNDGSVSTDNWKSEFEASLFEQYGVKPDRYEDLGDGIFQVYVTINGNSVPFVAVDSATGEYHG